MNIFPDLSNFIKNTIYAQLAHEHAETPTRAMKGGSVSSALMLAFADPMKAKLVDSSRAGCAILPDRRQEAGNRPSA